MKRRPQLLFAGALVVAVMLLAALNRPSPRAVTGPSRGACCPLLAIPDAMMPTATTNAAQTNANTLAATNRF